MNNKELSLNVHAPIPQKKLGRYRDQKGVYLIRQGDQVLYIGETSNIYKAAMRLFQGKDTLSAFDYNKAKFEVIITSLRSPSVADVLKRYFKPPYNKRIRTVYKPTDYEKRQSKRILEAYLEQSRFDVAGEHQTDSNPPKVLKP